MCVLLAASWSWLPSILAASVVSLAGAAAFVAWVFIDCSFPRVAQYVRQDIRLRFVHDAYLRYWHRWEWYGPRLWAFAVLAVLSAAATLTVLGQFVFGGPAQRSRANAMLVTAVVVVWLALYLLYHRLWWIAFRYRVMRLLPAMKAAEQVIERWPDADTSVFLPGLGNYGALNEPDHLLHADRVPMPQLWENIGSVSRKQDCYLSFGIESYGDVTASGGFRRCFVEYRMHGWSPPPIAVTEVRSPPSTRTVRHESDFPLGGSWYLTFYHMKVDFKDELDPDLLAEIAKRPTTTRLPHLGARFRAFGDTDVDVWILHLCPGRDEPMPMGIERRVLPKGEVVRIDYEPDPSRSTGCTLVAEDREGLEDHVVDPKEKKHRDYRGYNISLSYAQLDKDFEWLGEGA
jgi:hypothetical protein